MDRLKSLLEENPEQSKEKLVEIIINQGGTSLGQNAADDWIFKFNSITAIAECRNAMPSWSRSAFSAFTESNIPPVARAFVISSDKVPEIEEILLFRID